MRRRLTVALILAALIIVSVSGCHFRVTVHADPALQASSTQR
jgi:outer membrane lipopolysaccharide assembly protein LptE/RlpB